ncbi:unnamed protein product [Adineta ricciae]|uniref:Uncharacterized protein n=1 Tax=Adineta ricciae TaxID=249248 RepID=A0A814N440_ADIRI|nr:unnamed protein product [Adineta ricciae]CAF1093125.1 unnamed protein product [Adineta ricciae]
MPSTFSLSSCDWIGFDLDHTLIRYRLFPLHTLIYESIRQYLVDFHQYNHSLLQIPYDDHFAVKALIYDSLYGNLIQLDSQGLVHTALHGVHKRLSSKEIQEIYPHALEEIEEDTTKRFLCIYTYFEHSTSYLIANLVDLVDHEKASDSENKYSFFLKDIADGFEYLFNDFNRGNYFAAIRANPEKFIYQRSDVRQWLERLRENKKNLFLATNSRFDYTNLLSSYAFGQDWQSLFDMIIVDCKKPSFFSQSPKRVFHRMINENTFVPMTNDEIVENFRQNYIYTMGNSEDLQIIMNRISGKEATVIYFGDHIKSDIKALKSHTNWFAGVVVEELEFDVPPTVVHTKAHRLAAKNDLYMKGNRSKYFASFFTSPMESMDFSNEDSSETQTKPDAVLPALSSYWYTYITKHAHLSLSCLSVLANEFDLSHEFQSNDETKHFVLLH